MQYQSSTQSHEMREIAKQGTFGMPNLAQKPQSFQKMQKAVQAIGEPEKDDWIKMRINALSVQNEPEVKASRPSLLFTGQQIGRNFEFPKVPRLELKQNKSMRTIELDGTQKGGLSADRRFKNVNQRRA